MALLFVSFLLWAAQCLGTAAAATLTGTQLAQLLAGSNSHPQLPGWRSDSPNPCADPQLEGQPWPGLVCDATSTDVLELQLQGANWHGTLPSAWAALTALERIHLDNNQLHGSLPAAWGALTALESLTAIGNRCELGCTSANARLRTPQPFLRCDMP